MSNVEGGMTVKARVSKW